MTSQEYFDHFCKTEAGEFIYKTVEDVDGVYQMRPRDEVSQQVLASLFVLEDVYGYDRVEATEPENHYVGPQKYQFFVTPRLVPPITRVAKEVPALLYVFKGPARFKIYSLLPL